MCLPDKVKHLVVGAGPTGLGAALRLEQLGETDFALFEGTGIAGGLSRTDVTDEGFLFDMGGHVIFSHFQYFDDVINAAVNGESHDSAAEPDAEWERHERVSYVKQYGEWIEYPYQNNLYKLPLEPQIKCINGALDAAAAASSHKDAPANFDEWILQVMGEGIADEFMRPYNYKVWAHRTTQMQCRWLGERVATVNAKKVVENVLRGRADANWGPNATFRFPKNGGTGGIWTKVAKLISGDKQHYGWKLTAVDAGAMQATFTKCGTSETHTIEYSTFVCTVPRHILLRHLQASPAPHPSIADSSAISGLHHAASHIVGLGLRGTNPHEQKCWLYFPEDNCPFYRCTVYSHYAKANVPDASVELPTVRLCGGATSSVVAVRENCDEDNVEAVRAGCPQLETTVDAGASFDKAPRAGPYWSLMFEVSESQHKPVDRTTVVQDTIQGAINTGLVMSEDEIVSLYYFRLPHGYPVPTLERDDSVWACDKWLKQQAIWARGRFGSWKYEVGNQDHSLMLGVQAVDNAVMGSTEFLLKHCDAANRERNEDMKWNRREKVSSDH